MRTKKEFVNDLIRDVCCLDAFVEVEERDNAIIIRETGLNEKEFAIRGNKRQIANQVLSILFKIAKSHIDWER